MLYFLVSFQKNQNKWPKSLSVFLHQLVTISQSSDSIAKLNDIKSANLSNFSTNRPRFFSQLENLNWISNKTNSLFDLLQLCKINENNEKIGFAVLADLGLVFSKLWYNFADLRMCVISYIMLYVRFCVLNISEIEALGIIGSECLFLLIPKPFTTQTVSWYVPHNIQLAQNLSLRCHTCVFVYTHANLIPEIWNLNQWPSIYFILFYKQNTSDEKNNHFKSSSVDHFESIWKEF